MSSADTTTITVLGMTCGHCAGSVRDELTKLSGVDAVDVDLGPGQVTLQVSAPVPPDAVRAAVEEAGHEVAT